MELITLQIILGIKRVDNHRFVFPRMFHASVFLFFMFKSSKKLLYAKIFYTIDKNGLLECLSISYLLHLILENINFNFKICICLQPTLLSNHGNSMKNYDNLFLCVQAKSYI